MSIWCWIIPLLVGALCGLIGYLWGKGSGDDSELTSRLTALEGENARLQADLSACKDKVTASASLAAAAPVMAFDADGAKAAFGKRIKQDDLKLVEGTGPKIESLFHNFHIKTWKALSEVSFGFRGGSLQNPRSFHLAYAGPYGL